MAVSAQVIREQAAKADVALVTLGRTSGEFLDRMVADFNLTKEEQNMLKSTTIFTLCTQKRQRQQTSTLRRRPMPSEEKPL